MAGRRPIIVPGGTRYNMLRLIEILPEKNSSGNRKWLMECDCGTVTVLDGQNVRSGNTKSCGCLSFTQRRLRSSAGIMLAAQQILQRRAG